MKKVNKTPSIAQPIEADPVFAEKVFKPAQADPKKKLGERTEKLLLDMFQASPKFSFLTFNRNCLAIRSGWKDHNASKSSKYCISNSLHHPDIFDPQADYRFPLIFEFHFHDIILIVRFSLPHFSLHRYSGHHWRYKRSAEGDWARLCRE